MFKHIGKIFGFVFSGLLLLWWVPWHYGRCKFMILNEYKSYLIWEEAGYRIFYTIFAVIFLIALGYLVDNLIHRI